MSWPQIEKIIILKCHFSLILCSNNEPFLNWIVVCDDKWILYNDQQQPAQCLNGE